MKLTTNNIIIIFGILAPCVIALFPISVLAMPLLRSENQPNPEATVQALVTQTVISMTLNAPTQTPLPATATVAPVTNTPVPTSTSVPVTSYCDWVAFIKDVTVPDGTTLLPGEVFTKTWRLKNRGTCTWTPNYAIVFHSGAQMSGTTMQMPGYIAPGQTVDVAVTFTAPTTPGHYIGYWSLRNESGALFGTGDRATTPFYVDIYVKEQNISYGTVSGSLCYPSEFNPPMTLYFEDVHTGDTIQSSVSEAQNYYAVLLPAGRYYVYAWAPGYNLEGAYTHSNGLMKSVFVGGGQTVSSVNLCDWSPYGHARGE